VGGRGGAPDAAAPFQKWRPEAREALGRPTSRQPRPHPGHRAALGPALGPWEHVEEGGELREGRADAFRQVDGRARRQCPDKLIGAVAWGMMVGVRRTGRRGGRTRPTPHNANTVRGQGTVFRVVLFPGPWGSGKTGAGERNKKSRGGPGVVDGTETGPRRPPRAGPEDNGHAGRPGRSAAPGHTAAGGPPGGRARHARRARFRARAGGRSEGTRTGERLKAWMVGTPGSATQRRRLRPWARRVTDVGAAGWPNVGAAKAPVRYG